MAILQQDQFDLRVLQLVNQFRAENGRASLTLSEKLDKAADKYANLMASQNIMSHTLNNTTIGSRTTAEGYVWNSVSENIAKGYTTPEQVVQAWINSPGHRANMLATNITHMGLGYSSNGHYWSQSFARGDANPGTYVAQTDGGSGGGGTNPGMFNGTNGNDILNGTTGNDKLYGYGGNDKLYGYGGNDYFDGSYGNDYLDGGSGNDILYGGESNDTLIGGSGDDFLNGGRLAGTTSGELDVLTGGSGSDTFVMGSSWGVSYLGTNNAVLTDFDFNYDWIQVKGSASDYRMTTGNWGGTSAIDTALYKGNDCIALIQDTTNVSFGRDFNFV